MKKLLFAIGSILFVFGISDVFSQVHTLVLQPGPDSGIDCYFNSVIPDNPDPTTITFSANAWTFGGLPGVGRSLLKFDLTQIPATAVVLSAKLNLYYFDNGNGTHYGNNESLLQKVTAAWNKMTATWNNQPTATSLGQVYLPSATDPTQNYTNIDVTTLVSEMVRNPATNFGFLFRLVTEELLTKTILASCENPNTAGRPKLIIEYVFCPTIAADFNYQVEDQKVTFTDQTSGAISWMWDFGDGYFSNLKNPAHLYENQGIYTVCLVVNDSCGSDTLCQNIHVCEMPQPHFYYTANTQMVSFRDSSTLPQLWFWDFGDGFYSDLKDPEHYFNEPGTYYVCEKVTNACNVQTFCDSVTIIANAIDNHSKIYKVNIYPNPVHDVVFMSLGLSPASTASIELFTTQNSSLRKWEKKISPGNDPISLDVAGLSKGLYFLQTKIDGIVLLNKLIIL